MLINTKEITMSEKGEITGTNFCTINTDYIVRYWDSPHNYTRIEFTSQGWGWYLITKYKLDSLLKVITDNAEKPSHDN